MKSRLKKYGSIAIMVGAAAGGFAWALFQDRGVGKRTATAPAEIISAEHIGWRPASLLSRTSGRIRYGYRVVYHFKANNQLVSGVSDENSWYKKGEQCRVCYEPDNPSNNDLRDASGGAPCGSKFLNTPR